MSRRRLINLALEATAPEAAQPVIEMRGPLAEVFRKALDVAYAKKDTVTGEDTVGQEEGKTAVPAGEKVEGAVVATESQANDALLLAHMHSLLVEHGADAGDEEDGSPSAVLTVYGVSEGDLSQDTVVDITKELANKAPERDFVMILDSSQGDGGSNHGTDERFVRLESALEQMVLAHGGRIYHSLTEFGQTLLK